MGTINNNRVGSIDVVRGLAMVIMALDHIRDYFHITANTSVGFIPVRACL
jgi:uncharacterized membrane protein